MRSLRCWYGGERSSPLRTERINTFPTGGGTDKSVPYDYEVPMKIALFGGTFDPIHDGHIKVAETVINKLPIDQVWFVPAFEPPHKDKCYFSFIDRINLIKNRIKNNPKFVIYENDIRDNEKSYTILLIKELIKIYPSYHFYFIIGADNVTKINCWYAFDELINLIEFIVVSRETDDKNQWANLYYLDKLIFIDMPLVNISSTNIRNSLNHPCS